jgi:hypothetical protein
LSAPVFGAFVEKSTRTVYIFTDPDSGRALLVSCSCDRLDGCGVLTSGKVLLSCIGLEQANEQLLGNPLLHSTAAEVMKMEFDSRACLREHLRLWEEDV